MQCITNRRADMLGTFQRKTRRKSAFHPNVNPNVCYTLSLMCIELKHMLQRKNIQEQEMVQTGSRIDSILVGLLKKYIPSVMEGVQKEQIDIKTEPATKKTKQT